MSEPHSSDEAFLLLEAAGFELLLPLDYVLRVVEIEPQQIRSPEGPGAPSLLGRVDVGEGHWLELHSLAILAGADEPEPRRGTFETIEIALHGRSALLGPSGVGSIEEYAPGEALDSPALLWAQGRPWSPRAWPGTAASLRWELDPQRLGI